MNIYYTPEGVIIAVRSDTQDLKEGIRGENYFVKSFLNYDFKNYKVDVITLDLIEIIEEPAAPEVI